MDKEIVIGVVENVENISKILSFVTLSPIANEGWSEMRVPFYMELGSEYKGEVVNIITERSGLFGKDLVQKIEASNIESIVQIPYSLVRKINSEYEKLETDLFKK